MCLPARRNGHRLTLSPGAVGCAFIFTLLLGSTAQLPVARAQQADPPGATPESQPADSPQEPSLTAKTVQQRIEQVQNSSDLDEAAKAELLKLFQQALTELQRAAAHEAKAAEFSKFTAQAPMELQQARTQLDTPAMPPQVDVAPTATLAELETSLSAAERDLAAAEKELTALEAEPQRRADRRLEIPKQLEMIAKQLGETKNQLATPANPNESKQLVEAKKWLLLSVQRALQAQQTALTRERESYDAKNELLPKRRDLAQRQVLHGKKLVEAWQKVVHQRRQKEATSQANQARNEAQRALPELRLFAQENEQYARRVTQIGQQITAAEQQAAKLTALLANLERDFQGVTEKLQNFRLTGELGPYLLQYRVELRNHQHELVDSREQQARISDIRSMWIQLLDQRRKFGDLDERAEQVIGQLDLSSSQVTRAELLQETHALLEHRREILDALNSNYERYFRELADLTFVENNLLAEIDRQAEFINERILWVRSAPPLGRDDFSSAWEAVCWLFDPAAWRELTTVLMADLTHHPISTGVAGLALALLFGNSMRLRRKIREAGELAARGNTERIAPTFQALGCSALASLPWPALAGLVGWRLREVAQSQLSLSVGSGLMSTAGLCLILEFSRIVCRPHGLGVAHFGWPSTSMKLTRRHLRWFLSLGLPITFLVSALLAQDNDAWQTSLGRLLYMAGLLVLAWFLWRVLRPVGGVVQHFLAYHQGGWLDRLEALLFPTIFCSPLILAVLAGLGYFYTARQLTARLYMTALLLGTLLLVGAFLFRWVLVIRRRLAMEQARARRAAAQSESAESEGSPMPPVSDPEVNLSTINQQTRQLILTGLIIGVVCGLGVIWVDVLPALSKLNWQAWETTVEVVQQTTDAGGTPQIRVVPQQESVRVSNLLAALLTVVLTLVAGKNIPGLLEIAILQRLPLDAAIRYAITTVSRYVITVIGIVLFCGMLRIDWSMVQWLVAAVSVGLGFGLQEIFANFVSGLIILFERPVRVGDIVTIGDVSGRVSRIRIRATTITDWDRKELIVPNKEFITGRLLNWTLTDQVNRVVVNVGVAYGSDVQRVTELLMQIVGENECVLEDPPPHVVFDQFGDSSLNFVVRCYLPNLDNRLATIHALHAEIHRRFAAENIEIPFPQRDLHVRNIPATLAAATTGGNSPAHTNGSKG